MSSQDRSAFCARRWKLPRAALLRNTQTKDGGTIIPAHGVTVEGKFRAQFSVKLYLGRTHLPFPDTHPIPLRGSTGTCELCLNLPVCCFTFIAFIDLIFNISHFHVKY